MNRKILFNATATEKRAALLEDGKLAELVVERPDQYRILGNIYRGKVLTILPGIQSAFVDIGMGRSAFLHASDVDPTLLMEEGDADLERFTEESRNKRRRIPKVPIEKVLEVGQSILVQVIKEPIGNKSPKITTQISIAGRFLVLVPDSDTIGVSKKLGDPNKRKRIKKLISQFKPEGVGVIVRTIGLEVSEDDFVAELKSLIAKWKQAVDAALAGSGPRVIFEESGITVRVIRDLFSDDVSEVWVDNADDYRDILAYISAASPHLASRVKFHEGDVRLFDKYSLEKEIEKSLRRKVWLKSGGYLLFDHAEALLAIDVNTGRNVGKTDLEETLYKTNLEAVYEVCRQLRLRDIGGIIVVDFIDMRDLAHRRHIENEMQKLLDKDNTATSWAPISKFGLMEITRKRVRPELQELFTDVCPACNGLGRVFSPGTVTARIDRWLGRAAGSGMKGLLRIVVAPTVADHMLKDNEFLLNGLRKAHGFIVELVDDDNFDADEFEIYAGDKAEAVTEKFQ